MSKHSKTNQQLDLGPLDTLVFDQVQQMIKMLRNYVVLFNKVEEFCQKKEIETLIIVESRLAPDQFPFKKQIQLACDAAKFMSSRLSGKTAPEFRDDETSLDDLKIRMAKTIDYLETFKPEQFANWEKQTITVPWHEGFYIPGKSYFYEMAVPNFYFHLTTAYSILRELGIDVGKSDYLGALPFNKMS